MFELLYYLLSSLKGFFLKLILNDIMLSITFSAFLVLIFFKMTSTIMFIRFYLGYLYRDAHDIFGGLKFGQILFFHVGKCLSYFLGVFEIFYHTLKSFE